MCWPPGFFGLQSEDKMMMMEWRAMNDYQEWLTNTSKAGQARPNADEKSAVRSRKVSKVCLSGGGGIRTCAPKSP
jgi:hypothetical protein